MRERMDFSTISRIILDGRRIDGMSQTEYYHTLFSHAFDQQKYAIHIPEDADISKILKGQRNVPKDIIYVYNARDSKSIVALEESVTVILGEMSDPEYIKEQLFDLLWNDNTVSKSMREELSVHKDERGKFIVDCLLFVMRRKFIADHKKDTIAFSLSDYLLDYHFPSGSRVFVGREQELGEIHDLLEKNHLLFLEGIGGIGKSELAKQYVKRYKQDYSHVVYLRYDGDLKSTIAGLNFVDDDINMTVEELFHNHYRFFKQLDERSLIILDNFDSVPQDEELFHEFLDLSFQVLATTRSHIEDVPCYEIKEIQDTIALSSLFYAYAPQAEMDSETVLVILKELYYHTLTIELAAKTLQISALEPKELLNALRAEGLQLSNPNKVLLKKDSRSKKDRLYRHIQTLFQLQGLSTESINVLRNMVLIPAEGITKILFHNWLGRDDFNAVNDLIEYGWIQEDQSNHRIGLHPYIHEILGIETKPTVSSCGELLRGIFQNCVAYGIDVPYYNELLNTIESIYENIEVDDDSFYLFIDASLSYLSKYGRMESMERVLEVMRKTVTLDNEHKREVGVYHCHKGEVYYRNSDYESAMKHYEKGLAALEPFHPAYAELLSNLLNNIGQIHCARGDYNAFNTYIDKALKVRETYCLPVSHNTFVQRLSKVQALLCLEDRDAAFKMGRILLQDAKKDPGADMAVAQVYHMLAAIKSKERPWEALRYLEKEREHMRLGYLAENDPRMIEVGVTIEQMKTRVSCLENKISTFLP